MTNVLRPLSFSEPATSVRLSYQVAMPEPQNHLFEVVLVVDGWTGAQLDLKFPVWTPGSYLVREYARNLQELRVTTSEGLPLPARKCSKSHWRIETQGQTEIQVRYRVYANELSVRTNHLDSSHGYFNGAALFFYIPDYQDLPIRVSITPPPGWQVTTPLPRVANTETTYEAVDFDTLVDSPFEIGTHAVYPFSVRGKAHELAVWGQGNLNPSQVIPDIQKIIEVEADLFGGLPYDRYLFLLHLASQGNGGLEHKDCCSLNYPRFGFRDRDRYYRFLNLVAHEFFHLWNVKRIRPKALEVFDYDQENYTPCLWFSEGTTSYYDQLIPLRAGIYNASHYLKLLGASITRVQATPGRHVQSLTEASFDAWIKYYRPDANSANAQVSYYLKGEVVSLLLDLLIRNASNSQRSLDDVLRLLWQQFGKREIGFTAEQLQESLEAAAGLDLSTFFNRYVEGTDELDYNQYLEPFGLKLKETYEERERPPYLGLRVKAENGSQLINFVEFGSPAQRAGIDPGDELLAIDGLRVKGDRLADRLQDYQPGQSVTLTVFHQDELFTRRVTLGKPCPDGYQVVGLTNLSEAQKRNYQAWLGDSPQPGTDS
ncbi:M61 family metallopeptidase [Leptolyngbya sp. FACHB-261]|uniref:M61 family metallopeptidase n=1 Tax=Leptolyngbya sp. FACHB-261 TaxID=2692806 RepID=UPI00168A222F|nr:M61 family metallopeptidase [Leptolyngbya sp. FACHB-261]MBD2104141.1 M61 family metallopeptidase [Leptolyngbya sp. FACHB-261]